MMTLKENIINFFTKNRKKNIIKTCGCICICPGCGDYLNDQAECTDTDLVRYKCNICGMNSEWNFDIAPVPILLKVKD